jgi:hypothetical protein
MWMLLEFYVSALFHAARSKHLCDIYKYKQSRTICYKENGLINLVL